MSSEIEQLSIEGQPHLPDNSAELFALGRARQGPGFPPGAG